MERMTIAQFIVAYATCWWLVLFMVLPSGAAASANPGPGHAPSAPANPRLKRKFAFTTALAILPTILIYFIATTTKAEDTIYHVGSNNDCVKLSPHVAAADVAVRDGEGTSGKKVKGANLEGGADFGTFDAVDIPLLIPSQNYIDRGPQPPSSPTSINGRNVDLSNSFINAGKLTVNQRGDALLNDKSISNNDVYTGDCNGKQ